MKEQELIDLIHSELEKFEHPKEEFLLEVGLPMDDYLDLAAELHDNGGSIHAVYGAIIFADEKFSTKVRRIETIKHE